MKFVGSAEVLKSERNLIPLAESDATSGFLKDLTWPKIVGVQWSLHLHPSHLNLRLIKALRIAEREGGQMTKGW